MSIIAYLPLHYGLTFTDEYRVILGMDVGQYTDDTLSFLLRHHYKDIPLIRAVVGEKMRRRLLEEM